MSAEEFISPEDWDAAVAAEPLVDPFGNVKRAASIVGDLRKALREEGFTREEAFDLVKTYWDSEMGVHE
ncbi:DUF7187 family protein [Streptomyces parvus]|uniref:DUF7187 family protein n=1 Tax=Streptomyces parvus TaxID=66428 RepID=UPI003D73FB81